MDCPSSLRAALDAALHGCDETAMRKALVPIFNKYKNNRADSIPDETAALAYAASRMPATSAAVLSALSYALALAPVDISSVSDLGSGTGAAVFAALELFSPDRITCVEKNRHMRSAARRIFDAAALPDGLINAVDSDVVGYEPGENSDLTIEAYMLCELPEKSRAAVIESMFEHSDKLAVFVEPGTAAGFACVSQAREILLGKGAYIAAPCTFLSPCPMDQRQCERDFCHFTCRVQRSRLTKRLKGGDAPYEDENYSFLAVAKKPISLHGERVLRHPQITPGCVGLCLCSEAGMKNEKITKKQKDSFRDARKLSCGDLFERR